MNPPAGLVGRVVRVAATASPADGVTLVQEHRAWEAADLVARVGYDAALRMVGLWLLPADQALTDEPAS
ncbi:hypothetical protein [Corynebacterium guangdongense]|uniref:Uncharacterized protein n=1 Tax=Corynebacterium guangdongense TaxID=1783348 RepID=A0ABU1ZVM4_9CORY|nr:hypothetical protein [Corynebacterium guangdongense]MDR7328966.1 hypothetical protein [Corynebacterium guangdongense]WJZ17539.1 hypothetical protein CGUA_04765 [Corynebacterium guangdongense]